MCYCQYLGSGHSNPFELHFGRWQDKTQCSCHHDISCISLNLQLPQWETIDSSFLLTAWFIIYTIHFQRSLCEGQVLLTLSCWVLFTWYSNFHFAHHNLSSLALVWNKTDSVSVLRQCALNRYPVMLQHFQHFQSLRFQDPTLSHRHWRVVRLWRLKRYRCGGGKVT